MADVKPNAELAYMVLDQIDAHPERWDQMEWMRETSRGTAYCFAGWTVKLSGGQMEKVQWQVVVAAGLGELNGEDVADAAEHLLGIDPPACIEDDLFDENNTREDLGRLVAEIFGPRPGGAS
jgi:hypothetical protein